MQYYFVYKNVCYSILLQCMCVQYNLISFSTVRKRRDGWRVSKSILFPPLHVLTYQEARVWSYQPTHLPTHLDLRMMSLVAEHQRVRTYLRSFESRDRRSARANLPRCLREVSKLRGRLYNTCWFTRIWGKVFFCWRGGEYRRSKGVCSTRANLPRRLRRAVSENRRHRACLAPWELSLIAESWQTFRPSHCGLEQIRIET